MLTIYNTLTKQTEPLQPIRPGHIHLYTCGMTVYDYCHLGHGRVVVVFDMVLRYLQALGFQVTYVRNITDIDDKIIARARQNGESWQALTQRFIKAMHEDFAALGTLPPSQEPKATEFIPQIIEMVATLITKGFAYQGESGDIYYAVEKFPSYGKLSGKTLSDLRVGARVEINEAKRDPLDFVLWKKAKPDEPVWDSPWGAGRPGWHIECSAMSTHCLGNHFDIHGGGLDLQFPHHENEIAQSEAATGEPFVNLWMHNGFVQVNAEKMSKSLGNFFTLRTVLQHYHGEEIRFFILNSHYRSPLNYSQDSLEQARNSLTRLYLALRDTPTPSPSTGEEMAKTWQSHPHAIAFHQAMQQDFNTPEAIAVLFELARQLNKAKQESDKAQLAYLSALLRHLGGLLGLLVQEPEEYLKNASLQGEAQTITDAEIQSLIEARNSARLTKAWQEADQIRKQLLDAGILLEDTTEGTTWRRK